MRWILSVSVIMFIMVSPVRANTEQGAQTEKTVQIPQTMQQLQLSFAPIVKQVAPAVVNIYTKRKIKVRNRSPFINDPMFRHFFGDSFGGRVGERIESSLGSGVIVSADGLIITSHHVIDKSDEITVVLNDRREYPAEVLVSDEKTDLALLQIDLKDRSLSYLKLMDSDQLNVGDIVLAIGNPFGVGQTVTSGIVSGVARTTAGVSDYQFFIQTDAAINPGNSGGALVTIDGKLAGINTAIFSKSGGSNGIGFAIPANMVATVVNSSTGGGQIVRPWLGLTVEDVTQGVADSLGLDVPQGAIVKSIYPNGPAEKAALMTGDVIVAIDNTKVTDPHELHFRSATYKIGSIAQLQVIRQGIKKTMAIEMVAPIEYPKRDLRQLEGNHPLAGANVANLSPAVSHMLDLMSSKTKEGVVVMSLGDASVAKRMGFHKKDIIRSINGSEVNNTSALEDLMAKKSKRWKFNILRGNRTINIILSGQF